MTMPTDLQPLLKLLTDVQTAAYIIGGTAFLVCVIIAAIMRMSSFGNERRVSVSNMALAAAVVGLIIMLMATAIGLFIQTEVGGTPVFPTPTPKPGGFIVPDIIKS